RVLHVVNYVLFFFNILLGFFSCALRILLSVVFGTILIPRLDRTIYMHGFEQFDKGHNTYLGMLVVDLYHTHPILKEFVQVMLETKEDNSSGIHSSWLQITIMHV
ncbi:hypothetical protein CAPTEDRAFT_102905, partial [Capitella teleta]